MEVESYSVIVHFLDRHLLRIVWTLLTLVTVKYLLEWLRMYILLKSIPGPPDDFPPRHIIELLSKNPVPGELYFFAI